MFRVTRTALWVFLMFGAFLAACAAQPVNPTATSQPEAETPSAVEAGDLEGTSWNLVSFGPAGAETAVIEGSNLTLAFEPQGVMGGQGGCNSFGGSYTLNGQEISFGEIASTLRACAEEALNQQEMNYLGALNQVNRIELEGDSLRLFYGEQGVLNYTRAG